MINAAINPAFILGVALILSGVALYALRSYRPELSRDHDIFFAAIALISGLILMFQGWRLDPLLLLGQLSLAGSAVFFAVENIRLRGVTTEQAKRSTPIVDDDRPVSRNYEYDNYDYRAEFEELPSAEDRAEARRIRGSRDARSVRGDDYAEDTRRRPYSNSRRRDDVAYGASDRPRKRRLPRSRSRYADERYADARYADDRYSDDRPVSSAPTWDENYSDRGVDERPPRSRDDYSRSSDDYSRPSSDEGAAPRSSRRRPPSSTPYPPQRDATPAASGEYVDYQPVDYGDGEVDNRDYQDPYPY